MIGRLLKTTQMRSISSAFGESADVAFGTPFSKLHLRSAVRTRSNKRLPMIHRFKFVLAGRARR
jgi:hypothetical protein